MATDPDFVKDQFSKSSRDSLAWFDRLYTAMQALGQTMQKTDRILTGDMKLKVIPTTSRENGMNLPGFSTDNQIFFNYDKFKNIGSASTLVALMGLNYHELSHILFTPKNGRPLRERLLGSGTYFRYWNVLEDQRIESLFRAMYPPSGKYFTQMVIDFMVENEQTWPLAHATVYGRKFVPKNIRDGFKDRWAGTDSERREVEDLIDEFKSINFAALDYDNTGEVFGDHTITRATRIIERYATILQNIMARTTAQAPDSSCLENQAPGDRSKAQNGERRDDAPKDTRNAIRQMQDQEEEQDKKEEEGDDGSGFWDDQESGDESDSDDEDESDSLDASADRAGEDPDDDGDESASEESEGDSSGDDSEDGDGDDDSGSDGSEAAGSKGRGDDGSEDGEDDSSDDWPGGVGAGSDPGAGSGDYDFKQDMEDVKDAMDTSTSVKDDVQQLRDAINNPFALDSDSDYIATESEPVTPEMVAATREIEREFSRLYAELEPGWLYGSNTGKLNAERWYNTQDFEEAFDEWDEGHEQDSGLEVVMLLDTSASMKTQIDKAAQSVWTIKRSLDQIDATITILCFDAVERTLYRRSDKASAGEYLRPDRLGYSTIANQALHTARRILSESALPNKLLVAVTDGHWSEPSGMKIEKTENAERLIDSIDATKLLILVGLGNHKTADYFDVAKKIESTSEIAPLVAQAVNHMLKNVRR